MSQDICVGRPLKTPDGMVQIIISFPEGTDDEGIKPYVIQRIELPDLGDPSVKDTQQRAVAALKKTSRSFAACVHARTGVIFQE